MMQPVKKTNVLVAFNHTVAFDRRAFMGIAMLANELGTVRLFERLSGTPWEDVVRNLSIDGIIISRMYGAEKEKLGRLGIPFISVADAATLTDHEYVVAMDERAIGAKAARHFLDGGFKHFAVCVRPSLLTSFGARIDGFIREVESDCSQCMVGPMPANPVMSDEFEDETTWAADAAIWVESLPKPLAVFAPYDYHARVVVNVAQQAGLRVPDDVAVIGVDDDDVYCMTTSPQLSSVVTPGRQVGQLALTTLLDVLGRKAEVPRRKLITPPAIIIRGSSSDYAIDDPDVLEAVRFIREHATTGVTVDQVADHVMLSRRTLERRFLVKLSHTLRDEIRLAKVGRAKRLLIDTDLSFTEVAWRSGLIQQQQLNRVIKEATGQTPAQFRQHARQFRSI